MRLLLLILLFSCSKPSKPAESLTPAEELIMKKDLYLSLQKDLADENGWLDASCDGLLFNSLANVAGHESNIFAAEQFPGVWRRTPDFNWCNPQSGSSRSTISKDMFRGLLIYLISTGQRDALQRILTHGENNGWIFGEATDPVTAAGTVFMPPTMVYQIKRYLEGSHYPTEPNPGPPQPDYLGHLEVLNIYTDFLIDGFITERAKSRILQYAELNEYNGIYQAMAAKFTHGDYAKVYDILMNPAWFPNERLPMDTDRRSPYLFERDFGPNYEPCEPSECKNKTHHGIDLTFTVSIMLK